MVPRTYPESFRVIAEKAVEDRFSVNIKIVMDLLIATKMKTKISIKLEVELYIRRQRHHQLSN